MSCPFKGGNSSSSSSVIVENRNVFRVDPFGLWRFLNLLAVGAVNRDFKRAFLSCCDWLREVSNPLGLMVDDEGYCDWFPVLIQSKHTSNRQPPSTNFNNSPQPTTRREPHQNDFLRENRCH
jgi:hypothetical protein